MKKEYVKKRLICAMLAAVLCIAPTLLHSAYAQEADQEAPERSSVNPDAKADLTLALGNTEGFEADLAGKEITVKVYRAADITRDAKFTAVEPFNTANLEALGETTGSWMTAAKELAEYVDEKSIPATDTVKVSVESGKKAAGEITQTGLYLICPETVTTGEYTYTFQPYLVSLPSWNESTKTWAYDVVSSFKVERKELTGEIVIEKTLDSYNADLGGAVFVFEVTAYKDRDGNEEDEIVFSDMITLNFEAEGMQRAVVKDIPLGSRVEIREVYSGSAYELTEGKDGYQIELQSGETPETVTFTNTYNNGRNGGSGVVNHFEHTESADPAIRSWKEPVQLKGNQSDSADDQGE